MIAGCGQHGWISWQSLMSTRSVPLGGRDGDGTLLGQTPEALCDSN